MYLFLEASTSNEWNSDVNSARIEINLTILNRWIKMIMTAKELYKEDKSFNHITYHWPIDWLKGHIPTEDEYATAFGPRLNDKEGEDADESSQVATDLDEIVVGENGVNFQAYLSYNESVEVHITHGGFTLKDLQAFKLALGPIKNLPLLISHDNKFVRDIVAERLKKG